MRSTVRVGIVGAGYVADHHLRALHDLPSVEVVGVTDLDAERARRIARRCRGARVYDSLADMKAAAPDVIHVLTPPDTHYNLAREALELGCHTFIEKPMAETAAECDDLIARARAAGLRLSVNHSARFDPVILEAVERVREGACGDIVAVHFLRSSDYPPYTGGALPPHYRQGSYPFRDLGVHGLSLFELFLGPIRDMRVRHYETARDPLLTFDEWRADVECRDGTGYMFLSWNARPIQNELVIHGTRGVLHADCLLQTCEWNRAMRGPKLLGRVVQGTRNAVSKAFRVPWNVVRFAAGTLKPSPGIYRGVHEFYRALENGVPPPISPEDARHITFWIERSSVDADREKQNRLRREAQPDLEPARILVTGGGGLLGSALVARLREQGVPVRLLLRRPPPPEPAEDPARPTRGVASIVYGRLGRPDIVDAAMRGIDTVYHVGAATRGGAAAFAEGTIAGTRNIVDACVRHGVRRLVYVSSISVLDHANHRSGDRVTEASPLERFPERRGAYTQSKLLAERLVMEAVAHRHLPAVVIRPGQIVGPGTQDVPPNGVFQAAGRWIVAGFGSRKLPLVYRDDVVDALLSASTSTPAVGQIIHIVDSASVTQNEYLRHWRTAAAARRVFRVPVVVLVAAGIGVEVLSKVLRRNLPFSRYRVRSLKPLHPFDGSRAADLLGWTPRIGVREGLRRSFHAKPDVRGRSEEPHHSPSVTRSHA